MRIRGLRITLAFCLAASFSCAFAVTPLESIQADLAARRFAQAEASSAAALGATSDPRAANATELRLMALRARALTGLGRRAEAMALRESLVPAMERELGESDLDTLAELRSLAAQCYYVNRIDEALQAGRVAATRSQIAFGAKHRSTLMAEATVAQLNAANGNPEAAAALALDVLERSRSSGQDPDFIDTLRFATAQALRPARRYEEAVPLLRETFEHRSRRSGADAIEAIDAGAELAWTLARLGQEDLALAIVTEQHSRAQASLGANADATLRTASLKAEILARSGRYLEAMPLYADTLARAIASGQNGGLVEDTATMAIEHGLEAGDATPCQYLGQLEQTAAAAEPGASIRTNAEMASAFCRVLAGDTLGAQQEIEAVLAAMTQAKPGAEGDRLALRQRLAAVMIVNGQTAAARTMLEQTLAEAEALRAHSALLRRGGMSQWVGGRPWAAGGRSLARLLAEQGEAELAFAAVEATKARQLLDASRRNEGLDQLDPLARAMAESARRELAAAELGLALALDAASRARFESQVAAADAALARLARQQSAVILPPALPEPAADEVLVHLVADGDALLVLVRSSSGVTAHESRLGAAGPLVAAARRALGGEAEPDRLWRLANGSLVESPIRPPGPVTRIRDSQALQQIAAAITTPLAPHIAAGRRIVFAPDGAYALLPLEALPTPAGPLGAVATVSYAHSAAMAAQSNRTRQRLVAEPLAGVLAIGVAQPELPATGLDPRLAELHWNRLPAVDTEIAAVARRMQAVTVQTLLGSQASESQLRALDRSGVLRRTRWIHVAAHAWYSDASPELSALVLGEPGAGADSTAGYLTAAELRGMQLDAELVVLSACTSTGGAVRTGEGLVGLVHSLFMAGAAGTIVSLWPVADGATAVMMDALYARLAAGETPAQALTQARRALMAAGFAPRDWAAFVYYGAS